MPIKSPDEIFNRCIIDYSKPFQINFSEKRSVEYLFWSYNPYTRRYSVNTSWTYDVVELPFITSSFAIFKKQ